MRVLLAVLGIVGAVGCGAPEPAPRPSAERNAAQQAAAEKHAVISTSISQNPLTLEGHIGSFVTSVSFSPDAKRIVSGSGDKTLKVWDISSLDTSE